MDSFTLDSWKFYTHLWKVQAKMQKTKGVKEKEYWIGFIGGMYYVQQLAGARGQ